MKNRKIEFRAWHRVAEKMIDWSTILLDWSMYEFNSGHLFWMQNTGLEDKNGRDIYEGDILKTNGVDGEQLWIVDFEMSSYVQGFGLNNVAKKYSSVHNQVWDEGIVVGNIYENKELITKRAVAVRQKRAKNIA